jgi:hypothetical protein
MIRTLAVSCTLIYHSPEEDMKTAVDTASDEIVMGAVWASSEFSLYVSQQNHSNVSLTALDNVLTRCAKPRAVFEN